MKKNYSLLTLIILVCLLFVSLVSCSKESTDNATVIDTAPSIIYDQEVVDAKYLKETISDATSIYYKSSIDGQFGDENSLFEVTLLPSQYSEVEYIESNGLQYIDTGVKVSDSLSFDVKFSNLTSSANIGAVFGTNGHYFSLMRNETTSLIWINGFASKYLYKSFSPYKEYTVHCDKNSMTINGKSTSCVSGSNNVGDDNILLFSTNGSYASCRLFSFKISDNNTIVRDFIPCINNNNNKPGLYDLVTNEFYSNVYGTNFSAPEHNVDPIQLPIEYEQIDYLEFTGYQYFDTSVVLDSDFTIEYSAAIGSTSSTYSFACGCGTDLENGTIMMGYYNNRFYAGTNEMSLMSSYTKDKYDTYKAVIKDDNQTFYKNNELISSSNNIFEYTTNSLYIGSYHYTNPKRNDIHFKGNLYSFKIYSGETLIKNYIPAYRIIDNNVGLYDLINGKFISNIGAGEMKYGALINKYEMPDGYKQLNYIDSNGEQWIDTGVIQGIDYTLSLTTIFTGYYLNYNEESYIGGYLNGAQLGNKNGFWTTGTENSNTISSINKSIIQNLNFYTNKSTLLYEYSPICQSDISDDVIIAASAYGYPLFAALNSSTPTLNATYRMYSCAMYSDSNQEPIRLLVPCQRTSDLVTGLYDIVNSVFYSSKTTNFVANRKTSLLPAGYQQVEYIQSDGNQYIDTGILASSQITKIECDVEKTSAAGTPNILFGLYGGGNDLFYMDYSESSVTTHQSAFGYGAYPISYLNTGLSNAPSLVHLIFEHSGSSLRFSANTAIATATNECVFSSSYTHYLFGCNSQGTKIYGYPCKMYNFKVWVNDSLYRNFIPARNSSNVYGLYDVVNNVWYPSAVGSFTGGADISSNQETSPILPSEYRTLEYIESTGTQWIDTGVNVGPNIISILDWQVSELTNGYSDWSVFYGYASTSAGYPYAIWGDISNNNISFCRQNDVIKMNIPTTRTKTEVVSNTSSIYGSINIFSIGNNAGKFSTARNPMKLYGLVIYDNNVLVRDFVPCIRIQDNTIGLYDLVDNVFYLNQGTGAFCAGKTKQKLPDSYEELDYIETSGTQWIDTAFVPTPDTTITCKVSPIERGYLFGCGRDEGYGTNAFLGSYFNGTHVNFEYGAEKTDYVLPRNSINIITTYINDNKYYVQNNSSIGSFSIASNSTIGSFIIGAINNGSNQTPTYFAKCKYYYFKIYQNGTLIKDLIPCYRKTDEVVGMYDAINDVFYTNQGTGYFITGYLNNQENTSINESNLTINDFTYGNYVGHIFDNGIVITEPNEKQDGEIVYTCKICGKQIHKHIEASSYSITFSKDEGIDYIKVFNGYDLSTFEISDVAYTKNKDTNNFSKSDGIVYFEIVLKEGYSINKIKSGGTICKNVEGNIYYSSNITMNSTITITTKKDN